MGVLKGYHLQLSCVIPRADKSARFFGSFLDSHSKETTLQPHQERTLAGVAETISPAPYNIMIYLFLAVLGGVLAGIINTLAGSGSLVTLPILALLGLPSPIANATNRVGVVVQCMVASASFRRQGYLPFYKATWWWLVPTLLGSLIGAQIAVDIPEQPLNIAIAVIMVVMLIITIKGKKSFEDSPLNPLTILSQKPATKLAIALFFVGIYGGFIQAGVGVMLLLVLVTGAQISLPFANGLKMVVALGLASVALILFVLNDMIHWQYGLLMAVGQSIGAWLGVRFISKVPNASVWVRRLLIVILILGSLHYVAKIFGFDVISLLR